MPSMRSSRRAGAARAAAAAEEDGMVKRGRRGELGG
uniref:Uncharacterized protein n=1 Tax=Arundo donax TaxID=35708 RepID=A0A0A9G9D4_ARUDO